jgi:hypothetical protein
MSRRAVVALGTSGPRSAARTAALERILRIGPGAKVILSSGYDEGKAGQRIGSGRPAGFIRKLYDLEQLRGILQQVLGAAL